MRGSRVANRAHSCCSRLNQNARAYGRSAAFWHRQGRASAYASRSCAPAWTGHGAARRRASTSSYQLVPPVRRPSPIGTTGQDPFHPLSSCPEAPIDRLQSSMVHAVPGQVQSSAWGAEKRETQGIQTRHDRRVGTMRHAAHGKEQKSGRASPSSLSGTGPNRVGQGTWSKACIGARRNGTDHRDNGHWERV